MKDIELVKPKDIKEEVVESSWSKDDYKKVVLQINRRLKKDWTKNYKIIDVDVNDTYSNKEMMREIRKDYNKEGWLVILINDYTFKFFAPT